MGERAEAYDMRDYLTGLQLPIRLLYDATGNMFCPQSWLTRVRPHIDDWLNGVENIEPLRLPEVDRVVAIHDRLCEEVVSEGGAPCRSIVPHGR